MTLSDRVSDRVSECKGSESLLRLIDTPRPRSLGDVATPDATREVLPPSSPPSSLEDDARARLEAEMVAVSEKVSKQSKILPANLKWDAREARHAASVKRESARRSEHHAARAVPSA